MPIDTIILNCENNEGENFKELKKGTIVCTAGEFGMLYCKYCSEFRVKKDNYVEHQYLCTRVSEK